MRTLTEILAGLAILANAVNYGKPTSYPINNNTKESPDDNSRRL